MFPGGELHMETVQLQSMQGFTCSKTSMGFRHCKPVSSSFPHGSGNQRVAYGYPLGGTLNSSQGAINRSRSKNPYNNSAKPSYKLAFIPSSHFCYIFKTAQKRICPSASASLPLRSFTSPHSSACELLFSAISDTVWLWKHSLSNSKATSCRTCSFNNLSGFWDRSCTNTWSDTLLSVNGPVVWAVKIFISMSHISVRSESKSSKEKLQYTISHWEGKHFQPVHCFLCLTAERHELYFWQPGLHHYWNETVPFCPLPNLEILTCLAGKDFIAELQSSLQNKASFYRHLIWPDNLNPHIKPKPLNFIVFPENLPQAQLLYITNHYWKARKRNSTTDSWSSLSEDILSCTRLLFIAPQVMTV